MSFTLDATQFNTALAQFAQTMRIDGEAALKRVAGDVVLKACVMTPPSGGKTVAPHWAVSKKIGQSLIVRDNFGEKGVFSVLRAETLRARRQTAFLSDNGKSDDRFLWRNPDGLTWTAPTRNVVVEADAKRMETFRRPLRGPNGKVKGWALRNPEQDGSVLKIRKMLVSQAAANAWKLYAFAKLGKAKAGWNVAAQKLGIAQRFPAWVRRHTGTPGDAEKFSNGDSYGWHVFNDVTYGTAWKHRDRIMKAAMDGALKSMEAQMTAVLAKRAGKFNAKP